MHIVYVEVKMRKTYALLDGACSHVLFINDLHFISQPIYSSPHIYTKNGGTSPMVSPTRLLRDTKEALLQLAFYRLSEFHISATSLQYTVNVMKQMETPTFYMIDICNIWYHNI